MPVTTRRRSGIGIDRDPSPQGAGRTPSKAGKAKREGSADASGGGLLGQSRAALRSASAWAKGLSPGKQVALALALAYGANVGYKQALTLACLDTTNVAARWTMGVLRSYSFEGDEFFSADGAPAEVVEVRKAGFAALGKTFSFKAGGRMEAVTEALADGLSDIRFTDTNRVPFPFQKVVAAQRALAGASRRLPARGGAEWRDSRPESAPRLLLVLFGVGDLAWVSRAALTPGAAPWPP